MGIYYPTSITYGIGQQYAFSQDQGWDCYKEGNK